MVMQGMMKEKYTGHASRNLAELEDVRNFYAFKGYKLHTISTVHTDIKVFGSGDRLLATLVFEKKEQ